MKHKTCSAAALAALLVLSAASIAWADVAPATQPANDQAAQPSWLTALENAKHPTDWLSFEGDARLRYVMAPNLLLNQEDREFQRYRFRAGFSLDFNKMCKCADSGMGDISLNMRMVYEPRTYCMPDRVQTIRNADYINSIVWNEAVFDKANIRWANALGLPITFVVGRQDIIFGKGWLVLDGTPLDGSRTICFDAARMTIDLQKQICTTFDLVYIDQAALENRWLPAINEIGNYFVTEQNERGLILYATNKSFDKTEIDGYYIFKHDDRVLRTVDGVAPWQQGVNSNIHTFGTRVAGDITDHWAYDAEGAFQVGDRNERDLLAGGFRSDVSYKWHDRLDNSVHFGYEYLSGDHAKSDVDNRFDPLWGRWPQWSELYVYDVALEARPGETTNLHRIGAGWWCKPCPKLEWRNDWNIIFRDATVDGPYFDNGCLRGNLLTSLLKYKINKHVEGHLLGEVFFPGDYYNDTRNEVAGFFRYELTFIW